MTKKYTDLVRRINFSKSDTGIIPVIVQDASTNVILMLGYMNEEALQETIASKLVTFYSRSKQRLWVKGESSKIFYILLI